MILSLLEPQGEDLVSGDHYTGALALANVGGWSVKSVTRN